MAIVKRYKPIHFTIQELVDRDTLETLGEAKCWLLFPEAMLICLDRLREALGRSITINNWNTGGQYSYSGYRPESCTIGAKFSGHKKGYCFDLKFNGMKPVDAYNYIISHIAMFPEITELEDISFTPTWVHISCRPTGLKHLKIIKP